MEKYEYSVMLKIAEVMAIGSTYIVVSAGLITFNKYLMKEGRFPHAVQLTAMHMATTSLLSMILCLAIPSIYPSMPKAMENWKHLSRFMVPLGLLFSLALFTSNQAYFYSSVAFLQFCKQGNVAVIFLGGCMVGLQNFSWTKLMVLGVVACGCSMCATGEIKFALPGLLLQLLSQIAECTKNLIGEVVLTGAGLKLDVLTFVAFQAPFSLLPLLAGAFWLWTPEVAHDFGVMWHVLLLNACLAFALNVLIGLAKDVTIVSSSSVVFGDPISHQQMVGFLVTLFGHLKLTEQAQNEEIPIINKKAENA